MDSVAEKLHRSISKGDPSDHAWYEDALITTVRAGIPLDQVIWEAVRQILSRVEEEKPETISPASG